MITALKVDPSNQARIAFGGFNDTKSHLKKVIFMFMPDTTSLCAIGESGMIRKWNFSQ